MGRTRERASRRGAGRLGGLVRFSTAVVWQSARLPFTALTVLQLVGAALLAGQVLAVQAVLAAILDLPTTGAGSTVLPVVVLAALTAASAATGAVQASFSRFVGESVARTLWERILAVSTRVDLRSYEDPTFFDQVERVRDNALSRPFQLTNGVITAVGATVSGMGIAITLASFHPLLLPLVLASGVPLLLTSRWESRLEYRFAEDQTAASRQRTYVSLILTGRDEAKEVRAFRLQANLLGRFALLYRTYLHDLARHLRRRGGLNLVGQLTAAIVLGGTLLALIGLITAGGLTIAQAGAAIVAVRLLASQVQSLSGGVQSIFESGLFIDDLRSFLAMTPPPDPGRPKSGRMDVDEVRAEDVSFTYPGGSTPALDHVSIRIRRGEVVAVVGENGSGKTTLSKLVAGLYAPDAGEVTWGGVATVDLPDGAVAASTAVIFQDFVRYGFDARSNIALGRADDEVDEGEVRAAARASGIDDALVALPGGYDTPLTKMFEGGSDLSGGQWQRVAIARAFYRDAPLVVLDEPSAALDPRAEYDLFSSLRRTLEGRSALVISHRFSTVRNADRIYVMDAGRVVESGSHDELMGLDGLYAELFRLQATAYLPDDSRAE